MIGESRTFSGISFLPRTSSAAENAQEGLPKFPVHKTVRDGVAT